MSASFATPQLSNDDASTSSSASAPVYDQQGMAGLSDPLAWPVPLPSQDWLNAPADALQEPGAFTGLDLELATWPDLALPTNLAGENIQSQFASMAFPFPNDPLAFPASFPDPTFNAQAFQPFPYPLPNSNLPSLMPTSPPTPSLSLTSSAPSSTSPSPSLLFATPSPALSHTSASARKAVHTPQMHRCPIPEVPGWLVLGEEQVWGKKEAAKLTGKRGREVVSPVEQAEADAEGVSAEALAQREESAAKRPRISLSPSVPTQVTQDALTAWEGDVDWTSLGLDWQLDFSALDLTGQQAVGGSVV